LSLTLKPRTSVRAKISAVGTYVPPRLLTNADLEKMVETSNEWIMSRTGIRERHIVDAGVATSDLAVAAAKRALAERGLAATDIEAILVATVTPDMFFPSTACLVQHKLGADGAWGFDLSAACSAFLYALQTGAQFVATGTHKRVLVIGADVMSSILDYSDRSTCILFGDGAGAVILEASEDDSLGLIDFLNEVDGSGGCSLFMPGGGSLHPSTHETVDQKMHYVHQDGQAVFKYAVRKMAELCEKILVRNGIKGTDIAAFIPHQANKRIISDCRPAEPAPGIRHCQYRPLWQHHGGNHPPGHGDRPPGRQAEKGRSGAASLGGRGLYRGCGAFALGLLSFRRFDPGGINMQVEGWNFERGARAAS